MATASLTKMSVPAADNSTPSQGLLMPKLQYRFRVTFTNFGINSATGPITQQVMEFARPNLTFENIDLPIYNSTVKIAGKHAWQDITCKIRDDASGTASALVGGQLQKQLDFNEQSSSSAGINYKFTAQFDVLDGGNGADTPVALETWECYGCFLISTDYNTTQLAYGSAAPIAISLTIQPDNCVQVGPTASLGAPGFTQKRNTTAALGG